MKRQIILTSIALALTVHSPSSAIISEAIKTDTHAYDVTTYHTGYSSASSLSYTQCLSESDYCWRGDRGTCARTVDTGYSATNKTCAEWCEYMEYDVYVYTTGNEFGCACSADYSETTWKDYGTGRERQYKVSYKTSSISNCKKTASTTATSTYRCKAGYYGTASTGCTACPANAHCYGGTGTTTFHCTTNYYKNSNGCTACPSSRIGSKPFWEKGSGNGVTGQTYDVGATSITECYLDGLNDLGTLCDATGCFELTDECFYKK